MSHDLIYVHETRDSFITRVRSMYMSHELYVGYQNTSHVTHPNLASNLCVHSTETLAPCPLIHNSFFIYVHASRTVCEMQNYVSRVSCTPRLWCLCPFHRGPRPISPHIWLLFDLCTRVTNCMRNMSHVTHANLASAFFVHSTGALTPFFLRRLGFLEIYLQAHAHIHTQTHTHTQSRDT